MSVKIPKEIYIVNLLSPLLVVTTGLGEKIRFEYMKPVKIDFDNQPQVVRELLRNPELAVCNQALMDKCEAKANAKKEPYEDVESVKNKEKEASDKRKAALAKAREAKKEKAKEKAEKVLDDKHPGMSLKEAEKTNKKEKKSKEE